MLQEPRADNLELPVAAQDVPAGGDYESLTDDERAKLTSLVERLLARAENDERKPTERARRWRKYIALERPDKTPPWPGAPQVVTPIIRQKTDGVRAHIQSSLDQDPMFVVDPSTEEASLAKPLMEERMRYSMQVTNSREEILKAVRDAIEVGTGHLKYTVRQGSDGAYIVAARYVPFEDLFVYPSHRTRTESTNYFERYYEAKHVIIANVERGVYDPDVVDTLISDPEDSEELNEVEELWEVWVWYDGGMWEVRYSKNAGILSARRSVWDEALQRAPYTPIYIEPNQNSYWGDSIPQILEGLQEVSDAALNSELALAQFKLNPPMFISRSSPAYSYLQKRRLRPGAIVPVSSTPREDIYTPTEGMNPFAMQLMQIANQLTEEATFSDLLVPGSPVGGRKTATEVNVLISVGQLKLTNYYRNVTYSLERFIWDYWRLIMYYSPALRTIPDAGYRWEVNGKESTTEKQLRLNKLQQLLNPAFMQMIMLAAQNPMVFAIVKAILEELGLPMVERTFKEMVQGGMGMANGVAPSQAQAG